MNKTAHLAGVAFSLIFGFTFLFSKKALVFLSPIGLISYRFLLAFAFFEVLRWTGVIQVRFWKGQWKIWLPVALCDPILYFLFETYGLQWTTSGEAGMMIALIPIFVTVLSAFFLREKPTRLQVLFIFLSVAGILLIQLAKPAVGSGSLWGFLLLIGAVLTAAFFNIFSRKASRSMTPTEITYFMMLSAAVSFNVLYIAQLAINGQLEAYFGLFSHQEIWIPILYLGIVASIGGYFLVNLALSRLPAHVSSVYSNLSTIVAVVAGAVLLNEPLAWFHYVGGIMIIVGVYGTIRFARKPESPSVTQPHSR
jgi:drug/metabolite transporter (DMT)-like permease